MARQPWKVSDDGAYASERPGFSHDDILHFTQGSYGMEGQMTNRTVPESLTGRKLNQIGSYGEAMLSYYRAFKRHVEVSVSQ
ncbi:MAG: hypothetical protein IJR97_05360 [Clostridia bacterium]|nr:hypothetical protein [Clostridia bacterium]